MASLVFASAAAQPEEPGAEQRLDPVPTPAPEPPEAPDAAEPEPAPAAGRAGRRRARQPAGSPEGGEFRADDPATPENEAWEA